MNKKVKQASPQVTKKIGLYIFAVLSEIYFTTRKLKEKKSQISDIPGTTRKKCVATCRTCDEKLLQQAFCEINCISLHGF